MTVNRMYGCVLGVTPRAKQFGDALFAVTQYEDLQALSTTGKSAVVFSQSVQECIVFNRLELALSEKQMPDLLETLVVRSDGWSYWSRVSCAQGRRVGQWAVSCSSCRGDARTIQLGGRRTEFARTVGAL
jgi:hypothetical protein